MKEIEEEQFDLSAMKHSQSLFKTEAKVNFKLYQGDIETLKLNHRLKQLQVYFHVNHTQEEHKSSCAHLKLEVHALTWWESRMETLRMDVDPLMNKWKDFKTHIGSQFFHIKDVEEQWIQCNFFRQKQGQSVQKYTT